MNFFAFFQLRTKKYWWMDVLLYFMVSLLVAAIFSYVIFLVKNNMLKDKIDGEDVKLQAVGTKIQKDHETYVKDYKKKIADFTKILNGHKFSSNVFSFMQDQTLPNTWFQHFSFDPKSASLQLQGECEDLDSFSRQVLALESSPYLKSMGSISSSLSQSSKIQFNFSIFFKPNIINYDEKLDLAARKEAEIEEQIDNQQLEQTESQPQKKNNQKLITLFRLVNPDIAGQIDQSKRQIILTVPYGTELKGLVPSISISQKASIAPQSLVPQDFNRYVDYTVTAEDGTKQIYRVITTIAPEVKKGFKAGQLVVLGIIILILAGITIAVTLILLKKKKINNLK